MRGFSFAVLAKAVSTFLLLGFGRVGFDFVKNLYYICKCNQEAKGAEGYKENKMSSSIMVPVQVDAEEFWSNVLGSAWEAWDWWVAVDYSEGSDWDKAGEVTITAWDGKTEGEARITKTLTLQDLVEGYTKCLANGSRMNLDDLDACDGDAIIQTAMFGEVVYG